jgi:signal transduction histidine kinase
MKSLLGVPIKSKGEVFGNLYLADKIDMNVMDEEVFVNFSGNDMQLLEKFATQAAIAIENAQLYRQTQELAVLKERERFRMDLHDGIMQSVYATGLSLQEAEQSINVSPEESTRRINQAIKDLSQVMRDLRSYILGLQPERFRRKDLIHGLEEMAKELRANTFLTVQFNVRGKVAKLNETQATEVMHIVQEALTNIRKHAQARKVQIKLEQKVGKILLTIEDDGVGIKRKASQDGEGYGMANMRERAQSLGGDFDVKTWNGKGTRVQLSLDIPEENPIRD